MKVAIVGTGKVATLFGHELIRQGHDVVSVSGRNTQRRESLSATLRARALEIEADIPNCDLVLVAVSDDAIAEVSKRLSVSNTLVVHTSGTGGLDLLKDHEKQGVLWPIQSITNTITSLKDVPLVIEGNSEKASSTVNELASSLSDTVAEIPLDKRKVLHMTAVIVSNFPVHLMAEAGKVLDQHELPAHLLGPLWKATTNRVTEQGADAKLTGPARRGDQDTIDQHLGLLENDPELRAIYQSISESIIKKFHG